MSNPSAICQIPLSVLLQSVEKLIKHNEIETSQTLLHAITASHPQYTFEHALFNSTKPVKKSEAPHLHYIDVDYHTGFFEVFRTDNDDRAGIFELLKDAEEYVKKHG